MRSPRPIPDSWIQVSIRLWQGLQSGSLPKDLLLCSAAGTGKTFGVLTFLHVLARDNPGLRLLICRETRAALTESVLVTYEQEVLPLDGMGWIADGVKRRVRQSYVYPSKSEIVVGSLEDPERVLSTAWDVVFVNEAIGSSLDAWEALRSRMNRPGRSSRLGYLIGDTNPGHPSHWLKERVESGRTVCWTVAHEANPAMYDGRNWTDAGLRYLATLDNLTGTRRSRLRDGVWASGEGAWFGDIFDAARHVTEAAEYDPARKVFLAVDPGVFTGAVLLQFRGRKVNVFGDYLAENLSARDNAQKLVALAGTLCDGRIDTAIADPAARARTAIGPTVVAEYARGGLPLQLWRSPPNCVSQGLELIGSLLMPIASEPSLTIHPRCKHLINAFGGYMRAQRGGQWADYPEDPQHPHEDVMDALRGPLFAQFGAPVPNGRVVHQ